LRPGRLDAGEEVRVPVEPGAGEVVVLDVVLVGPDTGDDRRPAGAGQGGRERVGVDAAGRGEPRGHEGVEVRGVGVLDTAEQAAVQTDDQDLRRTAGRTGDGTERTGGGGDHSGGDEERTSGQVEHGVLRGRGWTCRKVVMTPPPAVPGAV